LNRYEQAQVPALPTQPTGINQRKHHFVFDVTVCVQDQFISSLLKTLGKTLAWDGEFRFHLVS
jgi:creatinine amidohydrolase/Fe(II)-dependent formamide hydrolase-like protein